MLNLTKSELKFLEMLLELNLKTSINNYNNFDKYKKAEIKENRNILYKVRKEIIEKREAATIKNINY